MEKMPDNKYIELPKKLHDECPNRIKDYEKKHPIKTRLYKTKKKKR